MAATRSENMSRIRSVDTAPERTLRSLLRSAGLRPTVQPHLPGSPDLAFVRRRIAIFLDGCFWHGCPQHYIGPRSREDFWSRKLRENIDRDAAVDDVLRNSGFQVIRIWQHELAQPVSVVNRIQSAMAAQGMPSVPGFCAGLIWWRCGCGSSDVQVTGVSEPGSLKPAGKQRPSAASLRCRTCGAEWTCPVPTIMSSPSPPTVFKRV